MISRYQKLAAAAAVLLVTIGGAWCNGDRHGARDERAKAYTEARAHIVDTLRIVKAELRVDTVRVAQTKTAADSARWHFASSDRRIKIVGRDSLSIDGAPAAAMVPAISIIPDLENARAMQLTDSLAYRAVVATLEHETHRGDLEERRADLAEAQLIDAKGPAIGAKTGIAIGAAVTFAVTHPELIVKAARWVLRLVH